MPPRSHPLLTECIGRTFQLPPKTLAAPPLRGLRQAVEEAEPGGHRTDLAFALRLLAAILGRLVHFKEALPVTTKAVELFRAVEEAEPGSHRADLGAALNSHSSLLVNLLRYREALSARDGGGELSGQWRSRAWQSPGRPATGLKHCARGFSALGRDQEALRTRRRQ